MTVQGTPIGYTPPVLMELLSGCRTDDEAWNVRRLLIRGTLLPFDVASDFEGSSDVYRLARRSGLTPNSHVDCMVIAIAARHNAALITHDVEQATIARLFGVTVLH